MFYEEIFTNTVLTYFLQNKLLREKFISNTVQCNWIHDIQGMSRVSMNQILWLGITF